MKSNRSRWTGTALIIVAGLLNFHIPHFLLEGRAAFSTADYLLAFILAANMIAALVAGLGIWSSYRWGWIVGIIVCVFAAVLWLLQETVGLPGLPQQWLEPSRLISLLVEASFLFLAWNQLWGTKRDERK